MIYLIIRGNKLDDSFTYRYTIGGQKEKEKEKEKQQEALYGFMAYFLFG
ncbi:hypothetical protein M3234_08170 [Neobacillus niacini]|nr:hypothetical protein [Neobacillus niacini]